MPRLPNTMARTPKYRPRMGARIARGLPFVIAAAKAAAKQAGKPGSGLPEYDARAVRSAVQWLESWQAFAARKSRRAR